MKSRRRAAKDLDAARAEIERLAALLAQAEAAERQARSRASRMEEDLGKARQELEAMRRALPLPPHEELMKHHGLDKHGNDLPGYGKNKWELR